VRLRTQLMLMFGIVAILPLTVVTLQGYFSSGQSYRRAVEAEAETLAESMGSEMERFTLELSRRMARLRQQPKPDRSEDYEKARRDALAEAERAQAHETLQGVLTRAQVEQGEIPFGLDADGQPIARHATDQSVLDVLSEAGLKAPGEPGSSIQALGDWVVVMRRDPASGLTLAIARPIGDEMRDIRQSSARNLGYGLAMAVAALLTIRPLSRRLTRNLARVTEGAERLAKGDLTVRVPVRSKDELGELAASFNRMAEDLALHQLELVRRESLRRELELCKRIQSELLTRTSLRTLTAEVHGWSVAARAVGGDFFNYFRLPGGALVLLVGDVSGKGVPAALLMANLQATLRARLTSARDLASLADDLDHEIAASTDTGHYLTLFAGIVDPAGRELSYLNAGHAEPVLVRAHGETQRLRSTGRPLALLPGGGYEVGRVELGIGDALCAFTDGLSEAEDPKGEELGEERLTELLLASHERPVDAMLVHVQDTVRAFRGRAEPRDDATLVVLKTRLELPGAVAAG